MKSSRPPALLCATTLLLSTLLFSTVLLKPALHADDAASADVTAPPSPKLIMISWDGAADWIVDRLLAEGQLPHLARMAARGVRSDYSVTSYPSKTAVGHASAWTGAWPNVSGITSNSVPLGPGDGSVETSELQHTVLEGRSGFDARALTAEPLYVTAALADKKVVVLSATQSYPPGVHVDRLRRAGKEDNLTTFSGFEHELADGVMLGPDALVDAVLPPAADGWTSLPRHEGELREATLQVADTVFYVLVFDDPAQPVQGFDSVLIRSGSRDADRAPQSALLHPHAAPPADDLDRDTQDFLSVDALAAWSPPLRIEKGAVGANTFFRLFELSPDGEEFALYQRSVSRLDGHFTDPQLADYLRAYPGFHDDTFYAYDRGLFGPPRFAGGDGRAERRVLELVAHDTSLLIEGSKFVLQQWGPDALFHYSPMIDSAGHTLLGLLDPAMLDYDAEVAAALWPVYIRTYQLLDAWLGALQDEAPAETVIALFSDHGMASTHSDVFPNTILRQAGLLHLREDGRIDLQRTPILMPPWTDFFLVINDQRWKHGITMTDTQRAELIERTREVFLDAKDPQTGKHLAWRIFTPDEAPGLGLGGTKGGDLYVDFAPGYYPRSYVVDPVVAQPGVNTLHSLGMHGYWPQRRKMHAIFYAMGPGLRQGVEVPGVRHIDIAPTLSRLLGIPAPARAHGDVIDAALDQPLTQP